ncbi:hypothetical protein [Enterovirga rhinocerotis]|uniref:Uncharacterized protein n=1 Tax=Enterovirga rhinocerotis TaxID=1339210 RepID=A0A4R7BUY1_9HYPH|nr:hypothetical protein [Enterovirga rhinocerotis]TDR89610.1 hypothetical protein EV668_2443 [Enterovirga rhinocerotis]
MALVMRSLAGLTLWAAGFSLLYGLHGLGCGLGWTREILGPLTVLNGALIALWLILLGLALWLALSSHRARPDSDPRGLARLALVGTWAGFVGLLLTGAPVLLPAHCL